ncbi:SOM1 protein [Purpureocillium lilacinum]|uniref:SOM1 protein n=1 Tax=Purpureocillium lilacinum TaxID=33203 RepID=A0A179GE15_PURLI|nr:SOM1 protein [Purpureocillium lilacinum]
MAMNPNVGAATMNPMGGPVGGAPMPMMNNVANNPQAAAAAAAAAARQQQQINDNQRGVLNTYIYEYFIRYGMFDCARSLLNSESQVNVHKDGANRRRDESGNAVNGADDAMDTDNKDDIDGKLPDDLPPPKLPMPASDSSFLYEWFCLFWDIYNAQRQKGGNGTVNQYVAHTQSRLKQTQQQELLRQMRPGMEMSQMTPQQQQYMMRNMQNGNMAMKQGNLARAAMANNQNPQMIIQQAKQNQMQRDPSGMENRDRPASPASGDNAPSPSKRPRIDGAPFNPNQPGAMMNGRPGQGMPGQQLANNPNAAAAHQMLTANGINPNSLNPQQFQNFVNAPPAAQQKSIATYSQNLQQHHGSQMGNKQMPNAAGPQGQGSPMMPQGPDGTALNAFYNPGDIGPGGIRAGPGAQGQNPGSNHALQDYQMQLMLLEQQNKKRLMMARQEQDNMPGMPREGGPGGPGGPGQGPNGQPFPDASPQAMRTGASPNPAEQMKRGTPQMNNSGVPSPVPEGGQSRGSPNPAMNFMGNHVDPNMAPHFFKGMEGNMAAAQAQMNGMRPPSSHPGQPFTGQMNPQQMMAARQQQQQQQGQPQQGQQGGPPQQWQQGPNGQMVPQGMQQQQPQQNPQAQGTPQQRSMPPPSAPAAAGANANNRTTASPQQPAAAPPTPNQGNKAAPKKKESKAAKDKRTAAQKKASQNASNAGATPAGDAGGDQEAPTPATPITPVNPGFKSGQNGAANAQTTTAAPAQAAAAPAPAPQGAPMPPQGQGDPNQNNAMSMDNFGSMVDFGSMELANPLQSGDVLNDFDFDSFLHEDNNEPFDFNGAFTGMEGGEIGAE